MAGRRTDFPILIVLLALILFLQLLHAFYYFRANGPMIPDRKVVEKNPSESAREKPIEISEDGITGGLVEQLQKTLPGAGRWGVKVSEVRLEAATGYSDIVLSARLVNEASDAIRQLDGRLLLLSATGEVVYQAFAVPDRNESDSILCEAGGESRVSFRIDNPPPFSSADLAVHSIDFAGEGFTRGEESP